jgi:hypothetical protein
MEYEVLIIGVNLSIDPLFSIYKTGASGLGSKYGNY